MPARQAPRSRKAQQIHSPKKKDVTRKGSAEKMTARNGTGDRKLNQQSKSGGDRSKRKLRRSHTAPGGNGGARPGTKKYGGGSSRARAEQIESYKSRFKSKSPQGSAAKRIREKHQKHPKRGPSQYHAKPDRGEEDSADFQEKSKRVKQSATSKFLGKLCGISSHGPIEVESDAARNSVQRLRLRSSDLLRLRMSFNEIDIDESGEIDYDEFMEAMEERRTAFTDAVFRLIDVNGDGLLEFDEFVAICGSFCVWSQHEILQFCFSTFDADGGGTIDEEEFEALCETITHKDPTFPGNFAKALEEFDTNGDGLIDFDEFTTLNRRYPMVLFPMFRLQDKMQRWTLGLKRWNTIMKTQHKLDKIREWRFTHGGEMPPETCCSRLTRCGAIPLGADEDMADVEREMAAKQQKGGNQSVQRTSPRSSSNRAR